MPYFRGKILDISAGEGKAFPHFIGHKDVGIEDPASLDLFVDGALDGVLSCFILHDIPKDTAVKTVAAWVKKIKSGGHIMLYLPKEGKWDVSYDTVVEVMGEGWDLVQYEEWEHLFFVFKLGVGKAFSWKNPKPDKTCAVVRLGAFGDVIQSSTILPWLKEQGYHITFYCSAHGHPVIKHDPHIDRFVIQGADEVPPQFLWEFWEYEKKKYTKWVNLSESVERTLLAAPGNSNHEWPNEVRAKYLDRNYLEFTHELAQVPPPYRPKFYSTLQERAWAKDKARSYGRKNVLWSLSGSSVHKTWPHLDAVIARLMLSYPDVHVVLVGDEVSQILEQGWQKERRVHCQSGKWTIRESMAFCEVADLVIGCETGLLNAAGCMDTPKIVTLSHSSEEMLTKWWKNVTALRQEKGCPKQPCRQLHTNWDHCMRHEDGTAVCQHEISAGMMYQSIQTILGRPTRMTA